MKFISVPENYAPVDEGLVYDIDLEGLRDKVDIAIIDVAKGEPVAVLRFAQTATVSLDIAPYVRRMFDPQPSDVRFGVGDDRGRTVYVALAVDGQHSPVRCFTMLLFDGTPHLLTTMPGRRTIAPGESVEVAVYAPGGKISICPDSPTVHEDIVFGIPDSDDIAVLKFAADCLPPDFTGAEVVLEAGQHVENLHFDRVERPQGAVRLAWTAASGAIEYYTFPSQRSLLTVASDAFCSRTGHRTTHRQSDITQTLVSDYEPQAVIEALEEILSARRVWRIDNGIATGVEVVTSTTLRRFDGSLNSLSIEIRTGGREEGGLC